MPNIGTINDVELLKKMKHAGTCHAKRLAKQVAELQVQGMLPSNRLLDKVVFVQQANLEVTLRLGELGADS